MATQSGSGYSSKRDAQEAAKEAIQMAMDCAGIKKCDLVMLFSTVGYNQQSLVATVRSMTKGAHLIGCTGEGVISFDFINESNTAVAAMVIKSDELEFGVGKVTGVKGNCENAGKELAGKIKNHLSEKTMCIWLFPDHLSTNYDAFSRSFDKGLPADRHIPIFGGMAADNWQFKQTFQYCDDEALSDGAVCVVMNGRLSIASEITNGCIPIGLEREITKSEGNIVFEIDNRKVTDVLQEYIPEEDVANWHKLGIRCLCIGLKAPRSLKGVYDEYVIRAMPIVDFKTGTGRISTELKAGTKINMISRNPEKLAPNAENMARNLGHLLNGAKPKFVLQIDCAGRGKVLRVEEKMAIQKKLQSFVAAEVPWLGLYCYGEMGPVAGKNYFHNFTVILAAFY
jgi:hypothetical protein